ncbi:MAG: type II secretion system F family protein [Thermodesulfovibrio sp.]|jgi:type II secretory pathway component PulF|uniref:Type II secretion system F family protein n=1 Tax=Thermodesulfovibrio obliviosus TaxID=3118332 RepID=A0AAU8H3B3_9BACT
MNIFMYRAVTEEGKVFRSFIKANNYEEAMQLLTMKNIYVLSMLEIPKILSPFISFFSGKIKNIHLIEFSKNLSIMLKAGVPLTAALADIAENMTNQRFKRIILDIKDMIEKGMPFNEAISMQKDVFPRVVQYLIKVGEETGRLDRSLSEIADYFQRIEDLRTAIKRALIYPIFATVVSFGAVCFWLIYVLPKIVNAMQGMGVKIPFITQIMVQIGALLAKFFYLLPVIPLIFVLSMPLIKKNKKLKWIKDFLSFKLPIIKEIFYNRAVALFTEQFRILTVAGIPIDNALDMTAEVVNNEIMKKAINNAKERITIGERISQSLKDQKIFPPMVIRLINIGETSGNLDEQLGFLTNYYTSKLQEYSVRLGKIIEPVMILFIGLFFAIILISLLSPLYDLISKLGGQ